MGNEQEIAFTFEGGVLRPDGAVDLPDGARGVAVLRNVTARANEMSRQQALATIRRIGDAGVFASGGVRLSRDEMHERD